MNFEHISNQQVLKEIGARFQMARLNENLSRQALAELSGVTEKTIANLEKGAKSVGLLNIIAILRALNLLEQLDNFMPEPPPRAAQLLKNKKSLRQRASRQSKHKEQPVSTDEVWTWGEDQSDE
ncbi:MAG: helix-turn-helix transcriptional regulator [Porticoccus sp.]